MTTLSKIKELLFTGYRWIFIIIGIAVIVEIIWAFRSLGGDVPLPPVVDSPKISNQQNASIILSVPKTTFKVGEKIPVSINIDSGRATDGTDVILNYDPNLLIAGNPVAAGNVYDDYPLNTIDEKLGKILISGISYATTGKVVKDIMGTVTFEAKTPGKAVISVDFTKGSTIDSNIIETGTAKDLLGRVENVEVEIIK